MMQYDAKLNGEQKLEHFKSLRRNRLSNDKLLKEELRHEEKNEESLCRGSDRWWKGETSSSDRFGDSETRESSVTMRNISANPDEKRKCRRRFSGYRIARVRK